MDLVFISAVAALAFGVVAVIVSLYLLIKVRAYTNYIVTQDAQLNTALDLNSRLLDRVKLAKQLIADSSISKSEKTTILLELDP